MRHARSNITPPMTSKVTFIAVYAPWWQCTSTRSVLTAKRHGSGSVEPVIFDGGGGGDGFSLASYPWTDLPRHCGDPPRYSERDIAPRCKASLLAPTVYTQASFRIFSVCCGEQVILAPRLSTIAFPGYNLNSTRRLALPTSPF